MHFFSQIQSLQLLTFCMNDQKLATNLDYVCLLITVNKILVTIIYNIYQLFYFYNI